MTDDEALVILDKHRYTYVAEGKTSKIVCSCGGWSFHWRTGKAKNGRLRAMRAFYTHNAEMLTEAMRG